ncbi:MAG TPA: 50S ribosomal protein L32 [Thermoanaerobacterales bacterium]|uniref:50S ribosomal protein L32 n=1 Tax=Tepidanaerobacter sp. GT38 TaxID=2722793 RepID=UPI00180752A4|nr:50S ribosomal protein L32 [Tepidanaerobacter sp. GT38]MCG1012125.1 50S ribosomal protein L32 [Tepidanaerobacter sp. GT38]HHY41660.1 50S ribosomal protein L32 [Thermoanaerobacterales bacterium]
MANPKHKSSKSRTRSRKSNWKLRLPSISECPQCHEPKLPHRACPSCGYYKNREVIEVNAN